MTAMRAVALLALLLAVLLLTPTRPAHSDPIVVTPNDQRGYVDTTVIDPGRSPRRAPGEPVRASGRGRGNGISCSYTPVGLATIGLPNDYGVATTGGLNDARMGLFTRSCSNGSFDVVWRNPALPTATAAGSGVVVTPEQLAQVAYSRLPLPAPRARFNPARPSSAGPATTVRLPTWWWVDDWSARQRRTSAGGAWAQVTARPTRTTWQPGDGGGPVVCDGPGQPWRPGMDRSTSTCAYAFSRSSAHAPRAVYTASVTVEWEVAWVGSGGAAGVLPEMSTTASFPVAVMERQSVVTGSGGGRS